MNDDPRLIPAATRQTRSRGDDCDEYRIYRACADDGNGMDITSHDDPAQRRPLKTFEEWLPF